MPYQQNSVSSSDKVKRKEEVGPRQTRRRINLACEQFLKDSQLEDLEFQRAASSDTASYQSPTSIGFPTQGNTNDIIHSVSQPSPLELQHDEHGALRDEIDVSANQIFPQPVSLDDESNYAPDSDIDSSSESADENDLFDWSVNGEEGQCDASEESDADDEFEINVKQSLVQWVVECNIPRCSVSNLLKRLHIDAQLSFLPLDSRTLMSSTRGKVKLVDMPPGKYQHFDLAAILFNAVVAMEFAGKLIPNILLILVNVDGIPLSNSSCSDFWPILIKIQGWDDVYVAGIYHGVKKPSNINDFLSAFRDDVVRLRDVGFEFRGKMIKVVVSCICCDAPATTFMLNITTHNAYYGCRKCTTRGLWVTNVLTHHTQAKTAGRVTFPEIDAPLRTDESFRKRLQAKHHHKDGRKSIVEEMIADIIADIALDYMHLVCIGVRKKDLKEWVWGKFDKLRFSKETISKISSYLLGIGEFITKLFARKPRPLPELPRWKATELRLDLLYICPVAYKPYLNTERYNHMMLLHVAIKLLVNRDTCQTYADYAESLLKLYVTTGAQLYGEKYVTFNVHNLIHLANDVRKHGSLDDFSAFPFENKLQKLKNLLRKSGKPLQQVVRRLLEIETARTSKVNSQNSSPISEQYTLENIHYSGPILSHFATADQYKTLRFKNTELSTSKSENCVFLENVKDVFVIENIIKHHEQIHLIGRRFLKIENMYIYPLPSSMIDELLVSNLSTTLESVPLTSVKCKSFRIPITIPSNGQYFVCPLVNHSLFQYHP